MLLPSERLKWVPGFVLVEKDELGGTCLNWGCIPTKSFLSDVEICQKVKHSDLFIHGSKVSLDLKKMVSRKNKVVETMKRGVSMLLESHKISLVKGIGKFIDPKTIEVSRDGKSRNPHGEECCHRHRLSGSLPPDREDRPGRRSFPVMMSWI